MKIRFLFLYFCSVVTFTVSDAMSKTLANFDILSRGIGGPDAIVKVTAETSHDFINNHLQPCRESTSVADLNNQIANLTTHLNEHGHFGSIEGFTNGHRPTRNWGSFFIDGAIDGVADFVTPGDVKFITKRTTFIRDIWEARVLTYVGEELLNTLCFLNADVAALNIRGVKFIAGQGRPRTSDPSKKDLPALTLEQRRTLFEYESRIAAWLAVQFNLNGTYPDFDEAFTYPILKDINWLNVYNNVRRAGPRITTAVSFRVQWNKASQLLEFNSLFPI